MPVSNQQNLKFLKEHDPTSHLEMVRSCNKIPNQYLKTKEVKEFPNITINEKLKEKILAQSKDENVNMLYKELEEGQEEGDTEEAEE